MTMLGDYLPKVLILNGFLCRGLPVVDDPRAEMTLATVKDVLTVKPDYLGFDIVLFDDL
jgi:hypothetical protein